MLLLKKLGDLVEIPNEIEKQFDEGFFLINSDKKFEGAILIEDCIQKLSTYLDTNPNNDDINFAIALCYVAIGRKCESIKYFSNAYKSSPDKLFYLLCKAETNLNLKKYSDAIKDFSDYIILSKRSLDQLKYQEAFNDFKSLLNKKEFILDFNIDSSFNYINPNFSKEFIGRGKARKFSNDLKGALLDWSYAAQKGDKEASELLLKEMVHNQLNINEDKIKEFEIKALKEEEEKLFYDAIISYNLLIEFYKVQEKYHPNILDYYYRRGCCHKKSNDILSAILDWSYASKRGHDQSLYALEKERQINISEEHIQKDYDINGVPTILERENFSIINY